MHTTTQTDSPTRFIAGVGLGLPATSFPLAVICGLGAGALVGYLIYKGGNKTSLQIFLVISTCFLYLVAAGLFSKGVWNLEQDAWVRLAGEGAAEAGAGPGSYDIRKSVWHVNVSLDCISGINCTLHTNKMPVLLATRERRWRLGHLQLAVRMAEQRHVRLSHLVQSLLAGRHCRIWISWMEGEQGRQCGRARGCIERRVWAPRAGGQEDWHRGRASWGERAGD